MIKFAIIGTSSISEKFIDALKSTEGCEAYALLSRDENKGKRFAEKFGIEKESVFRRVYYSTKYAFSSNCFKS